MTPEEWVPEYRRRAGILIWVLAFFWGLTASREPVVEILMALSVASGLVLWCTLDSRMHGKLFLRSYGWTMMFTWPVGMLVYLVWTRRGSGFGVWLLGGAAFYFAMAVGYGLSRLFVGH